MPLKGKLASCGKSKNTPSVTPNTARLGLGVGRGCRVGNEQVGDLGRGPSPALPQRDAGGGAHRPPAGPQEGGDGVGQWPLQLGGVGKQQVAAQDDVNGVVGACQNLAAGRGCHGWAAGREMSGMGGRDTPGEEHTCWMSVSSPQWSACTDGGIPESLCGAIGEKGWKGICRHASI